MFARFDLGLKPVERRRFEQLITNREHARKPKTEKRRRQRRRRPSATNSPERQAPGPEDLAELSELRQQQAELQKSIDTRKLELQKARDDVAAEMQQSAVLLSRAKQEAAKIEQQRRRERCLVCKLVVINRHEHMERCLQSFIQSRGEEVLAKLTPQLDQRQHYDELTDEAWSSSGEDDQSDYCSDESTVEYAQSASDDTQLEDEPMEHVEQTVSWIPPVLVPEAEAWRPVEPSLLHRAVELVDEMNQRSSAEYTISRPRSPPRLSRPVHNEISNSDGSYIGDFRAAAATTRVSWSSWDPPPRSTPMHSNVQPPPSILSDWTETSALDGMQNQAGWSPAINAHSVGAVSEDPGARKARVAAARSRVEMRVEAVARAERVGSLEARIRARAR